MEQARVNLTGVVTGGTKGIGLGIAAALLRRGASVAVTYRGDEPAAQKAGHHLRSLVGAGRGLLLLRGDVGDPESVAAHHREVLEKLGPVNVLVNNAGIMPKKPFEGISPHEWDETLRINLNSVFYWTSRVVGGMKTAGFGRIVNISSLAARGGGVVGAHYAASKAGMLGFTKYLARELGGLGITVNAIAPAFIEDAGIFAGWTEEQKNVLRQKVAVPLLGKVEDVVRAFEYFLDTPFVTGMTFDVNGGAFMA